MKPAFLFALAFSIPVGVWIGSQSRSSQFLGRAFDQICTLVEQNYFEDSEKLREWAKSCHSDAQKFQEKEKPENEKAEFQNPLETMVKRVSAKLNELEISHLAIWDPTAMRSQWLSESKENGIRVRRIADQFIVRQLVEDGPGMRAGISLGDEILSIDKKPVQDEWSIRTSSGQYEFVSGSVKKVAFVETEEIRIDEGPRLEFLEGENEGLAILTIPTFVSTYFEKDDWRAIANKLQSARGIVVDLRGNSGGHFVAMLRALSPFLCQKTSVGRLIKPRLSTGETHELEDNIEPNFAIDLISKSREIRLNSYSDYGCFKSPVVALIDQDSASTTEIFASALLARPYSAILGDFSAGQVVQAVWHPLLLGKGFALSIPDSLYYTERGETLEGIGVRPRIILQYDLQLAREGIDSWIQDAITWIAKLERVSK